MDNGNARGGGPGLPRHTFADDPFFRNPFPHDPPSDVYNDFGLNSQRRRFGGSNPRVFEDDFFDNFANGGAGGFGTEPSFFRSSLPRRGPPTGNVYANERPINVQRQQTTPQKSPNQQRKSPIPPEFSSNAQSNPIHHQRQSSSNSHYGGGSMGNGMNQQQPQPPQQQGGNNGSTVHVIPVQQQQQQPKNIVEINNADPNSYTNGQLNPDKRRRFSTSNFAQPTGPNGTQNSNAANLTPIKVPIVKVEDYSTKEGEGHDTGSPAISEHAIPLPAPPSAPQQTTPASESVHENKDVSGSVPSAQIKIGSNESPNKKASTVFVPLAACTEQLVNLLDETERRVEQLRETASQLEQEKELVLEILNNVKLSAEMLKLEQSEEDEVNLTAERILKRCRAVDVVVNTPRNEDQSRALDEVNMLIQSVVAKMQDDLDATKFAVQRFLNACSPDEPNGPIDQKFQTKIVACTADDQKKIRRKLAQIIAQIDRAERVCQSTA